MTLISYAQNHEDILLWRALKHIDNGFYIDIGACFPVDGSVTKLFYDRGWHGINVEPHPVAFQQLCDERIHDINLQFAVTDFEGELLLYEGDSIGETSSMYHGRTSKSFSAKTMPLNKICEQYVNTDIEFLKIDVEGLEYKVLASGNWERFRPKVVVCETTQPWTNKNRDDFEKIKKFFQDKKYDYIYFDGLNSYFVENEAEEIKSSISFQPNVIDGFISFQEYSLQSRIDAINLKFQLVSESKEKKVSALEKMQSDIDELRSDNQQLRLDRERYIEQITKADNKIKLVLQENLKIKDEFVCVQNNLNSVQNELSSVQDELNSVQNDLDNTRRERDSLLQKLDNIWHEKEETRLQFEEVWNHRDAIQKELNDVYHSRSFRITSPFRSVMGRIRIVRGKLANMFSILNRILIITPLRITIHSSAQTMRRISPKIFNQLAHNVTLRRIYLKMTSSKHIQEANIGNQYQEGQAQISSVNKSTNPYVPINPRNKYPINIGIKEKLREEVNDWKMGERSYE